MISTMTVVGQLAAIEETLSVGFLGIGVIIIVATIIIASTSD